MVFAEWHFVSRHKLFYHDAKTVRDALNAADDLAQEIHARERMLIAQLYSIDQKKYYVRFGFKSLSGFCIRVLGFSRTQTQRIVTQVRRYEPTVKIVDRDHGR